MLFARDGGSPRRPPEQRILAAALDCIAESGLDGATVRGIAAKAGLNAAAVNYYYRSKKRLIEAALRLAWNHVAEDLEKIGEGTSDAAEGLEAATRYLLEGAVRYPNVIHAILVERSTVRDESASSLRALFGALCRRTGRESDSGLGTALLLAFAVFVGIAPEAASALIGADLGERPVRDRLAGLLAPRFFPPAGGKSSA